jgi:hypothetical protein
MTETARFKIGNVEYPIPSRFRFCDPVLIRELTGLEFQDFAERADDQQKEAARNEELIKQGNPPEEIMGDPAIMTGLLGVAIWQANPTWKRERVVRYVESLGMEEFSVEADDAGPPEVADQPSLTLAPSAESTSLPESSSQEPLPA